MLRIPVLLSLISLLPAQGRDGPMPVNVQEQLQLLSMGTRSQRAGAAMQLGSFGVMEAVPGLIAVLRYPDTRVQTNALSALNELGATSAIEEIRRFLSSSNLNLRMLAALTLLHLEDTASQKAILDLIHNDDVEVRRKITQMLNMMPVQAAVSRLEAALEDEDLVVRGNAISALGKIDVASSEEKIAPFLDAEEEQIRTVAFMAVTNIAPEKYEDLLREAFHSGDQDSRHMAVAPLLRLQDAEVEEMLFEEDPSTSLLNYFHAREACEKLRSTRVLLRQIRWSNLGQVLRLVSEQSGIPVELSPSLVSIRSATANSAVKLMGHRPETFALLSNISPQLWNGIQVPVSWIFDDGKIRIVPLQEAREFFQEQANKRKDGRDPKR